MNHLESIKQNRTKLEEFMVEQQKNRNYVELSAYDVMIESIEDYTSNLSKNMDNLINDIMKNGQTHKNTAVEEVKRIIVSFGHLPAYIFVLNFDLSNIEHTKRVFKPNYERISVGKRLDDIKIKKDLQKIAYEDGAIIVDSTGRINCTNAQLVNVNPMDIPYIDGKDPYETIGFKTPVNTRHFSAVGASYHMPGCIVYVLGEQGHIRRFEKGKISFSTVKEEVGERFE